MIPQLGSIWITTWSGQEHQGLLRVDTPPIRARRRNSSLHAPGEMFVRCSRWERGSWIPGFETWQEYFGAEEGAGLRVATSAELEPHGLRQPEPRLRLLSGGRS